VAHDILVPISTGTGNLTLITHQIKSTGLQIRPLTTL
jgi:hypothetical protein